MSSPAVYPQFRRRRSLVGPVVLIIIGLLFLLKNFGVPVPLFRIFAQFWPVLLILAGLVKILESYRAQHTGEPTTRLGGGTIFLLIVIAMFGSAASAAYMHRNEVNWGEVRDQFQMDDDFMHLFGNTYTYDGQVEQVLSPNASLKVVSDRGNITVTAWDQPNLKVVWHKRLFASNQEEADRQNGNTNPQFSVAGDIVTLTANTQGNGPTSVSTDMEVFAPKKLAMEVSGHRGDIAVNGREGDLKLDLGRGDVTTDDITGNIIAEVRRGSLHVSRVTGNVTASGRIDELLFSDINGTATLNGDVFGDLRATKVAKNLRVTTSRTNFEVAKLEGDVSLDSGQLQVSQAVGPLTLTTRAKDISLSRIDGDIRVSNDAGDVSVEATDKLGNINIENRRGDVHVSVPAKAQFDVSASTRHGDVESGLEGLSVSNPDHGNSVINGRIGKGGPHIQINTDSGDIRIAALENAPVAPPAPPAPPAAGDNAAPKAPKTPKTPKSAPAQPTQPTQE